MRAIEIDDALESFLAAACSAAGVRLFDLELRAGALIVTVERDGGLDLDQVAEVARALSSALDEREDLAPEDHYELEVSTPGVERRLRRPEHFAGAIGEQVAVRLSARHAGARRLEGRLTASDDEAIELDVAGTIERVEYESVERAHTIFDWKAALAASRRAEAGSETDSRAAGSPTSANRTKERP